MMHIIKMIMSMRRVVLMILKSESRITMIMAMKKKLMMRCAAMNLIRLIEVNKLF